MLDDLLAFSSCHFNAAEIKMSIKGNFEEESHYTGLHKKMYKAKEMKKLSSIIMDVNVCGS